MNRPVSSLLLIAALVSVLAGSTWPVLINPGEYARTYAARAMVERGTWEIGPELRTLGSFEDRARVGDKYYSNKPPGLIWLAVPVVEAVAFVAPGRSHYVDNYAARVVLSVIPALLAAALLAAWLRRRARSGVVGAGLLLFGTFWGLSATAFCAHVATGTLVLACAWLLYVEDRLPERMAMLLAGFLGCLCVASEYQSAVVITAMFATATVGRWRRIPAIFLGLLGPAMALGLYNLSCFGKVLTLSNRFDDLESFGELGQRAAFGMGPRPRRGSSACSSPR